MTLPVGTQLGRYTVLRPLVSGGMAEVLLARAQGMGGFQHHVVIKAIRANKATEKSFINAFVDEARLSASLHHNHIVQVHDVGHEGNDYFFAMEYVHGENLRKLLTKVARARELVPFDQIITIAIAVAAGLHHAHQQNIVHRDVTPANILVAYDGNVKVTDFGIAKALLKSSELTKSGNMRGKVAYMAPEQCLGRTIDRRSDIFSLGIVLYELCTSRRLFKGDTDFLVMTSIVNGKIPKPTLHRKDLPLDLEDLIMKALAPKPELRFTTAEELALALEAVAVNNRIRISATALAEYMSKLFGTRPEPWLVDASLESVDVDFDGGGSGLVQLEEEESAIREWPVLDPTSPSRLSPPDRDEFADDQRTQLDDPEDEDDDEDEEPEEPPTLLSGNPKPTSGFEGNESTLIGEQADVDMLVRMSQIDGRRDATPVPRRDATPIPQAQPSPPRADMPVPAAPPQWAAAPSGSGTPMAWISNEGDVPSLAPKGSRVVLIAAVAIPIVVIGILLIMHAGGGEVAPVDAVEPDAFVEPPPQIDAPPPPDAPMAASPVDAGTPQPAVVARPPAKKLAVKPVTTKKPPITKKR